MQQEKLWRYLRWVGIGLGVVFLLYLLFHFIGKTINLLLISAFFAASISPLVEELEKHRIPRSWAIAIIYTVLLFVIILTVAPAPSIIAELSLFFTKLPELINQINIPDVSVFGITREQVLNLLQSTFILDRAQAIGRELASRTVSITIGLINALGIALLTLVFTAYFVINAPTLVPRLLFLLPPKLRVEVEVLLPPINRCLGAYVLGKIGTSALLGFLTYLAISTVRVPYAAALGLLVAVTNLIPFVGPILGLVPMVIAAWKMGTTIVITVIGISFILQQLEAWFLQPWLVGPYLNLDPFELLLSLLVGAEVAGVVGVLIAPPIAGTARIIFNHIAKKYNLVEDKEVAVVPLSSTNGVEELTVIPSPDTEMTEG
ncbi:MAG: AI-2E family transporter [Pseudanabaenaceae cyanobacterium SKYGB_i_bin29]|nr:AI-2E family transporter [Pseudanabaenaceae cyanobacterium SKYG29]MDW8421308.1 AI-2E family transporter [Pseudanabaenaceae cyanobacterium SKYGB_i_bin29]